MAEITSIQQAISSNSLSIHKIKVANPTAAALILEALISEVVLFFNVGKNMNEFQIKQTAILLLSELESKNMKPEDYRIMFNNAKTGKYGGQFDRLDGQMIFEWVRQYWHERSSIVANMNDVLHSEQKSGKYDKSDVNPEGQKKVAQILKDAKVLSESKSEIQKPIDKKVTERDIFIQKCFSDFELLYKKSPLPVPGRFIMFNGRGVDQIEYCGLRVKEYDNSTSNEV